MKKNLLNATIAVSFLVSAQVLKAEEQLSLRELMQNEMTLFDHNLAKEQKNENTTILEKINADNVNLSRIFSVDLRHDENFLRAIDSSIQFYTNILDTNETFQYGNESYSPLQMLHSLILFRKMLAKNRSYEDFLLELKQTFDVYQPKSNDFGSKFTGYYTPEIQASSTKTKQLTYPLYLSHTRIKASKPDFYVQSRRDIKALEMEGAGILALDDGGMLNLQYAGRKTVLDKILAKKIKVVKKTIRVNGKKYVKVVNVKRQPATKAVFYIADNGPLGALSTQLVPGYSAAMDMDLTPSGSLIYIKSNDSNASSKNGEEKKIGFESFMLVHDTGGAIKGPGRVDIYCGEGSSAKNCTYNVSSRGSVYLLVAKKESLKDFVSE